MTDFFKIFRPVLMRLQPDYYFEDTSQYHMSLDFVQTGS